MPFQLPANPAAIVTAATGVGGVAYAQTLVPFCLTIAAWFLVPAAQQLGRVLAFHIGRRGGLPEHMWVMDAPPPEQSPPEGPAPPGSEP